MYPLSIRSCHGVLRVSPVRSSPMLSSPTIARTKGRSRTFDAPLHARRSLAANVREWQKPAALGAHRETEAEKWWMVMKRPIRTTQDYKV
jgi:hypothetical protein